jgi:hypothetical protein
MIETIGRLPNTTTRKRTPITFQVYGNILKAMYGKTFTRQDVMDASGLHNVTARRLEQYLMREGMIHIVGWLPGIVRHHQTPIWRLGPGEHKPKPILGRKRQNEEYNARRRAARAEARALRLSLGLKR